MRSTFWLDVHAATDSPKPNVVAYIELNVVEIDTGVQTVKVEPVSPATTGDSGDIQKDQGLNDIALKDIVKKWLNKHSPSTRNKEIVQFLRYTIYTGMYILLYGTKHSPSTRTFMMWNEWAMDT